MAGIYIHIPFCRQACHYCNFHFSTSLRSKNELVQALLKEMEMRKNYLKEEPVSTIYFGGGTPSLLTDNELTSILKRINTLFHVEPDAEITLEANPDDFEQGQVSRWKHQGINRLSIGIQSFLEQELQWMNRAHNADQALDAIRIAQEEGIPNLSIDLIYGTPTLADRQWEETLKQAAALNIPHISSYALTVEPKTALEHMIRKKAKADVDQEVQSRQFHMMTSILGQEGYEHYEISNFARPSFRSRHNSSYWSGSSYLGLGPAAHSYDGVSRQWNIANNALYIKNISEGKLMMEKEALSGVQQLNEYLMTSLRTIEGIDLNRVRMLATPNDFNSIISEARKYSDTGKLNLTGEKILLTEEGKFFADGIAASLFI